MIEQNKPSGSFTAWDNTMCNPLAPARDQCQSAWHDGYASAKQEWVGLTDEEIKNFMIARWPTNATPEHFIQAIEAKLKEKNT